MNQRLIGPAFLASIIGAIVLMVTYALGGNTQIEGIGLFLAFGGIGTAMILWAKHLLPNEEVESERHTVESTPAEQKEFEDLLAGGASQVTRRRFLSRMGGAALGALGLAALFPLKSLGPNPGDSLFKTNWSAGKRLMTQEGRLVRSNDLLQGGVLTVFPEGEAKEDSDATLLIRIDPSLNKPRKNRENWAPEGNIAYSKTCTHVGCPVGLYRETTHELLCPCHQSTFDVLDGARAVFGPAARSLPQLPLEIDSEGYLQARMGYQEPIGPGFWNRGRRKEQQ